MTCLLEAQVPPFDGFHSVPFSKQTENAKVASRHNSQISRLASQKSLALGCTCSRFGERKLIYTPSSLTKSQPRSTASKKKVPRDTASRPCRSLRKSGGEGLIVTLHLLLWARIAELMVPGSSRIAYAAWRTSSFARNSGRNLVFWNVRLGDCILGKCVFGSVLLECFEGEGNWGKRQGFDRGSTA